jgi:hypothetical protein
MNDRAQFSTRGATEALSLMVRSPSSIIVPRGSVCWWKFKNNSSTVASPVCCRSKFT